MYRRLKIKANASLGGKPYPRGHCINAAKAGSANWMGNAIVDCIRTVGGQGGRASGAMASFSSPPVS